MFWKRKKAEAKDRPDPKIEKEIVDSFSVSADQYPASEDTDRALLQYIEENAVQRKAPAPKVPEGIAMDSACSSGSVMAPANYETISPRTLAYYVASSSFIGYSAMSVIGQHWLVRKGLEKRVRDAARKWYRLASGEESTLDARQLSRISSADKRMKLKKNVIEALTFNRMFGIRHVLFKHKDPDFDYSAPFNPEAFSGGNYAGISQIDPQWMIPEINNDDLSDPASINFYEPEWWWIGSKKYHKSHFAILTGDMVPDVLKPTYRYGGISMTQKVYERVYAAERCGNEAPKMLLTKRTKVRKVDLAKYQADKARLVKNLNLQNEMQNNHGTAVIGLDEEINHIDTALSDFDQVIKGQYGLVCAVFGDPESKLLGSGHAGLGTGETDDDYYIAELEELQGNEMTEVVEAHYQRLMPSLGIEATPEIIWDPLKVMSEKEAAEVQEAKARTAQIYFNIGAVDEVDIRENISADEDSGYNNLPAWEVSTDDPEDQETEI